MIGRLKELDTGYELMVSGICEARAGRLNEKSSEGDEDAEEIKGKDLVTKRAGSNSVKMKVIWCTHHVSRVDGIPEVKSFN